MKKSFDWLAVIIALFACFAGAGCGGGAGGQGSSGGGDLEVVATYSILGDMVRNVGGEGVEVTTLVGPDGDAHSFEPSPRDAARLSEAALIFENGMGFETWLDELYESSGSEARRVVVTEKVEPLTLEGGHAHEEGEEHEHEHSAEGESSGGEGEHSHEGGAEGEHGHDHGTEAESGELDPHVWFDVGNALVMVEAVRDALVEADPENAEAYERNAREYFAELEGLDAEVREQVGAIPEEDRKLVTTHDTFGYLAEAYDFEVVGTALASYSTETSDPAAGETAELVGEIEAAGVPAIFAENTSNPALMQRLADEAGVDLAPPLYTDALGEPGTEGATYVEMVRYDARTISEALGG